MLSTLVIVPARGGSKRLPGKNLCRVGGETLLARTAAFLRSEGFLDKSILSTEDPAIAAEGRRVGLAAPFDRPQALSSDDASTVDVVIHALDQMKAARGDDPDVVAVLQVTTPFRPPGLLREALSRLEVDQSANAVIAMARLHVAASYVFCTDARGRAVPASQRHEPALVPTGSLYLTRATVLRQGGTLYANPILPIEVARCDAIDIDTAEDLRMAEIIADQRAIQGG